MKEKFITFFKGLKDIDKSISKVMNYGFVFSLIIGILAIATLVLYKVSYISYDLVDASIILFRTGILFTVQFLACGYAMNTVKKFS